MLITPTFLSSLETNMSVIANDTYKNLLSEIWWTQIAKQKTSTALKEVVIFSLEAAKLHPGGVQGGFKDFDVLRFLQSSVVNSYQQSGFELTEAELSDTDAAGVDAAAQWAREITVVAAYQPQKTLAEMMIANPLTYDGLSFFNTGHFVNGSDSSNGTYSNSFAALPIDTSVTLDVAATNLNTAIARIRGTFLTPTGYPRNLRVRALLVPPALAMRAQQLTQARFIPGAAASGGGTADFSPVIANWGLGIPTVAPEIGASFSGGSDTTYYIVTELLGEMGAFQYFNRQPYSMLMHDKMTDAELDRADKLQWIFKGRNSMLPMHPFGLVRVLGA